MSHCLKEYSMLVKRLDAYTVIPIYLQPFLRYSKLLVENCDIFILHLCLAPPQGTPSTLTRDKNKAQNLEERVVGDTDLSERERTRRIYNRFSGADSSTFRYCSHYWWTHPVTEPIHFEQLFINSFIRPSVHSSVHSFIHSFIQPVIIMMAIFSRCGKLYLQQQQS